MLLQIVHCLTHGALHNRDGSLCRGNEARRAGVTGVKGAECAVPVCVPGAQGAVLTAWGVLIATRLTEDWQGTHTEQPGKL